MPSGGVALHRSLQHKLSQVLQRRLRGLHFHNGSLIPSFPGLTPGARTVIQEQVLEYGEAKLMAPEANDIPLVEVSATENEYKVVMPIAGFAYSFQESLAQNAIMNGSYRSSVDTRRTKMSGARRVVEERCNDVAAFGDTGLNFTGLMNNPSVTLNNTSFDPFNAATTADALAEWFLDEIGTIPVTSNTVEYPTVALISVELSSLMDSKKMSGIGETVKSFVLRTQRERSQNIDNGGIRDIVALPECRSSVLESKGVHAGGNNKDRIVLYDPDQENLERHFIDGMIQLFPEDWTYVKDGKRIYPLYSCVSETIINFPGSIRYVDHAKKS